LPRRKSILSRKHWAILFIVACIILVAFYYYVYEYKPSEYVLPKFSLIEILLFFAITFFPSVISRIYANVMTDQVDLSIQGVIDSFRDSVHGWYSYYILAFIAFTIWDLLIYNTFPEFW